jgi:glycerate kinase
VDYLDQQLRIFSSTIKTSLGVDVSKLSGGGAAGGMGAGVKAFLNGELKSGIDTVLDLVGFENLLDNCDWVFTGEGKLDYQSLSGKVVIGVGHRAMKEGVPVIAVVGEREEGLQDLYRQGVARVYETSSQRKDFEDIRAHCREDLRGTMDKILGEIPNV